MIRPAITILNIMTIYGASSNTDFAIESIAPHENSLPPNPRNPRVASEIITPLIPKIICINNSGNIEGIMMEKNSLSSVTPMALELSTKVKPRTR